MASATNTNTRDGKTAKKTYTTNCIGSNDHGSVTLGHLHKPGDVIADVLIQASDGRHSIVLDKDGPRKACTQITAPGRISILSGEDKKRQKILYDLLQKMEILTLLQEMVKLECRQLILKWLLWVKGVAREILQ
jgi:hypothetical protein